MQLLHPSLDGSSATAGVELASVPSRFEQLFTSTPPLLDNLLLHLPTPSILDLYHTSQHLRYFLRSYPLAWKNLSFRLLPATQPISTTSGAESPDPSDSKRPYALDLLLRVILPYGTRLTRLDLDNTSISGTELYAQVLEPRRHTLQHLSVRGCKDVSLKYHVLPFLQVQTAVPTDIFGHQRFALKSLYTYRCRHHRRRPYFPSSLNRRDSDSQPTHQLVELCHLRGIWTDTAWCPTPGPRCYRRKDYYTSKLGAGGTEVWVPFDRLWRSQNLIGPTEVWSDEPNQNCPTQDHAVGRLWEDYEYGYGGEPLGSIGEGKELPMHLRKSHRAFIEGYQCHSCKDKICERCEQCSVRMHCMGCRVTLCHSCAFDKPIRRKRRRTGDSMQTTPSASPAFAAPSGTPPSASTRFSGSRRRCRRDPYWWAPGAMRNPNLLHEIQDNGASSSDEDMDATQPLVTPHTGPHAPRLELHWCCLRPCFSGGGGIGFIGTPCGDGVRAAPLPKGKGFEDPDFLPRTPKQTSSQLEKPEAPMINANSDVSESNHMGLFDTTRSDTTLQLVQAQIDLPLPETPHFDIVPFLEAPQESLEKMQQRRASPRSLCSPCYNSPKWKIHCAGCRYPICIEHDIKKLKVRKCGYRRLDQERALVQQNKECVRDGEPVPKDLVDKTKGFFYNKWRPLVARMAQDDEDRRRLGKWTPRTALHPLPEIQLGKDDRAQQTLEPPSLRNLHTPSWSSDASSTAGGVSPLNGLGSVDSIQRLTLNEQFSNQQVPRSRSLPSVSKARVELSPSPHVVRDQSGPQRLYLTTSNPGSDSTFSKQPQLSSDMSPNPHITIQTTTQPLNYHPINQASCAPDSIPNCSTHNLQDPQSPLLNSISTSRRPTPWTGCNRYFCPPRQPGDPRPACRVETSVRPCTLCQTYVCASCADSPSNAPLCNCSACRPRGLLCPNCRVRPDVRMTCRKEKEEEAWRQFVEGESEREAREKERVKVLWEETAAERGEADELAEGLGEFLMGLDGGGEDLW